MGRVQNWFEKVVGVTEEELRRREFAQRIFGQRPMDISALQRPACWRRLRAPVGRR